MTLGSKQCLGSGSAIFRLSGSGSESAKKYGSAIRKKCGSTDPDPGKILFFKMCKTALFFLKYPILNCLKDFKNILRSQVSILLKS